MTYGNDHAAVGNAATGTQDRDSEPVYWFCNSCGEEVDDETVVCCDDGENEPSYDESM